MTSEPKLNDAGEITPSRGQEEFALAVRDGVPPPLSPLRDVVISPANIALEARVHRAQTLSLSQRIRTRTQIKKITRQLEQVNYNHLASRRKLLRIEVTDQIACFKQLEQAIQQSPQDMTLFADYEQLQQQITSQIRMYRAIDRQVRNLKPVADRRQRLVDLLEDHTLSVQRIKAERRARELMEQEAKIYETLLVSKWTALGFCHRYKKDGKDHVDKVRFSECAITMDAIYFKIDAAYKTAFNNWKTALPDGVYIAKQLLADETLTELSITCQRQVTGVHNTSGAWVIVHRLNSHDGLLNYVSYADVQERYPVKHHSRMPICVGVGAHRQIQWINLADFPHWLIAGYTKSGKSNLVNASLCTLITHQSPTDLRLVLIDLKGGLEFSYYSALPHLHGEVVDSVPGVADMLAQMEALMNSRFERFRGVARSIEVYRAKRPNDYMPRVAIVFDEVASVMNHGDTTRRIMASLGELTRKGRAVGIHIILCTQRPDVHAVDGAVKANLAVRISGRLPSTADSLTVLGTSAAKDLAPVLGRMVMQVGPEPQIIQTPHIEDQHIADALVVASHYPAPPQLDIPAGALVVHQEWTPERIIELSIKHLNGNLTAKRVKEAVGSDLSHSQSRELVERVWRMPVVEYEGQQYRVVIDNRRARRLELVDSQN